MTRLEAVQVVTMALGRFRGDETIMLRIVRPRGYREGEGPSDQWWVTVNLQDNDENMVKYGDVVFEYDTVERFLVG